MTFLASVRSGRGNDCMGQPELRVHSPPPHADGEEQESGSDSLDTLSATVMDGIPVPEGSRLPEQTRNPLLLLRLSGVFLLRFAERQLVGLLFQAPPRRTRLFNRIPSKKTAIPARGIASDSSRPWPRGHSTTRAEPGSRPNPSYRRDIAAAFAAPGDGTGGCSP